MVVDRYAPLNLFAMLPMFCLPLPDLAPSTDQLRLLLFQRATAPITAPETRARRRAVLAFEEVPVSDPGFVEGCSVVASIPSRSVTVPASPSM